MLFLFILFKFLSLIVIFFLFKNIQFNNFTINSTSHPTFIFKIITFYSPLKYLPLFYFYFFIFQSSTETVLAAEFHPSERNTIVTCGKGHISFWTLEGGALTKKMGIFDVRTNLIFI